MKKNRIEFSPFTLKLFSIFRAIWLIILVFIVRPIAFLAIDISNYLKSLPKKNKF